MGFKIAGRSFTGRYKVDEIDEIEEEPGLYAVLCYRNKRHYLVDVGESENIKEELEGKNGKKTEWDKHCSGRLLISVYYTPDMEESDRNKLEKKIRNRHNPPCGKGWPI
ncbi:hypothetical protein GF312_03730 [Candidatus Poribacteria bacterium]|nr:hypothetical protein [Candidatus Poribacteria bacterium]